MTRRMFLAVPSDPLVPEGRHITYLPDGLMVDLGADMRCGTCVFWREAKLSAAYGFCDIHDGYWRCGAGCTDWEPESDCPTCKGTGNLTHTDAHDTEVWTCPDCKGRASG